jgi:L-histidine Nalpha-methyltransferase / hercynylcysteine S-oxide synthase
MLGTFEDGLEFIRRGGLGNAHTNFHYYDSLDTTPLIIRGITSDRDEDSSTRSSRSNSVVQSSPTANTSLTSLTTGMPSSIPEPPLYLMFLGSSLGNFTPDAASKFLRSLPLRPGSNDKLLIGLDHDNDKDLIERAYNDKLGITKDFIMNGLKAAGRILGNENAFDLDTGRWDYVNFYNKLKSLSFPFVPSLKIDVFFFSEFFNKRTT